MSQLKSPRRKMLRAMLKDFPMKARSGHIVRLGGGRFEIALHPTKGYRIVRMAAY